MWYQLGDDHDRDGEKRLESGYIVTVDLTGLLTSRI